MKKNDRADVVGGYGNWWRCESTAGKTRKPIDEQLSEREVITTPQERKSNWAKMENLCVIITS